MDPEKLKEVAANSQRETRILSNRISVVLNLHVRSTTRARRWIPLCKECGSPWPCDTRKVLLGQKDRHITGQLLRSLKEA
jgi:hypothetical protein